MDGGGGGAIPASSRAIVRGERAAREVEERVGIRDQYEKHHSASFTSECEYID